MSASIARNFILKAKRKNVRMARLNVTFVEKLVNIKKNAVKPSDFPKNNHHSTGGKNAAETTKNSRMKMTMPHTNASAYILSAINSKTVVHK